MKHIIILFALLIGINVYSQSDNCSNALPLTYDWIADCKTFTSPFPQQALLCRKFVTGGNQVNFDQVITLSNCPNVTVEFILYDNNCDSITFNQTGIFNIIPYDTFIVCLDVSCLNGGVRRICIEETLTLPIELLYFTAESTVNSVNLLWSTASELNNAGFLLERSTDLSNWTNIGFVEGAGNSQQTLRYSFQDINPIVGVNYYRMVQYDIDGKSEMMQTIAIFWNPGIKTNIFRQYNFLGQKIR